MNAEIDSRHIAQETPPQDTFIAPSIDESRVVAGQSYAYYSSVPKILTAEDVSSTECVLGIDEAGRGPVLGLSPFSTSSNAKSSCSKSHPESKLTCGRTGPMVYACLYLPVTLHRSLLAERHHFDDSKALTPQTRSNLMRSLCSASTDLYHACGWAVNVMSARDISAGMLRPMGPYNLNAQAMDATVELIRGVLAQGVNVKEMYVDTIGAPQTYQNKLSRIFPNIAITVAKKADSLYPCVSAASVCAKVTRDAALEVCHRVVMSSAAVVAPGGAADRGAGEESSSAADGWGSGYPSDARCSTWLRQNMDPVFGWGNECRFSWSTAKDMLEGVGGGGGPGTVKVDWPDPDADDGGMRLGHYFYNTKQSGPKHEMEDWYGTAVPDQVF